MRDEWWSDMTVELSEEELLADLTRGWTTALSPAPTSR